jgi:hypothetical protein
MQEINYENQWDRLPGRKGVCRGAAVPDRVLRRSRAPTPARPSQACIRETGFADRRRGRS